MYKSVNKRSKTTTIGCRVSIEDKALLEKHNINLKELVLQALEKIKEQEKIKAQEEERKRQIQEKRILTKILRWFNEYLILLNKYTGTKYWPINQISKEVVDTLLKVYKVSDIPKILLGSFYASTQKQKHIIQFSDLLNFSLVDESYNIYETNKDKIMILLRRFCGTDIIKQAKDFKIDV